MEPRRRKRQPTPVFLPGKSRGQRSLTGYSPWNELDMTECLSIHTAHSISTSFNQFYHSFGKSFLTTSLSLNLLLWVEYLLKVSFFVAFARDLLLWVDILNNHVELKQEKLNCIIWKGYIVGKTTQKKKPWKLLLLKKKKKKKDSPSFLQWVITEILQYARYCSEHWSNNEGNKQKCSPCGAHILPGEAAINNP